MKVISCYRRKTSEQIARGWTYWDDVIGQALPCALSEDVFLYGRPREHRQSYTVPLGMNFDIAYCEAFQIPTTRPARICCALLTTI